MNEKKLKDLSELLEKSKKYEGYLKQQREYFSGEIRVTIEKEMKHQNVLQEQCLKAIEYIQKVN